MTWWIAALVCMSCDGHPEERTGLYETEQACIAAASHNAASASSISRFEVISGRSKNSDYGFACRAFTPQRVP